MKKYIFQELDSSKISQLLRRPAIDFSVVMPRVEEIFGRVQREGDAAVQGYTKQFDKADVRYSRVPSEIIRKATSRLPQKVEWAFRLALGNIEKFHQAQARNSQEVETMPGVSCFAEARPIEKVGLYIPGGSAPLPSTVLMLAIPAVMAGCKEIVLCTPPDSEGNIPDIILCVAHLVGVRSLFRIGGAQAIAAMALGTQTVPKVNKIFGPGNQYVTAAKMFASTLPGGPAIDLPAGPTEVLVIADESARAEFVAADLLSQAEHGPDSQAIFLTTSDSLADAVLQEVDKQLQSLPRQKIAQQALENSFVAVVATIKGALDFSNRYAPEHLTLNVREPRRYVTSVQNAGSVFLGGYSPEAAGDYASGTNHTLPTYGYAKAYGGVSLASFQKVVTFQELTCDGLQQLGGAVMEMARQENLEGHRRAVEVRLSEAQKPAKMPDYAISAQ